MSVYKASIVAVLDFVDLEHGSNLTHPSQWSWVLSLPDPRLGPCSHLGPVCASSPRHMTCTSAPGAEGPQMLSGFSVQ